MDKIVKNTKTIQEIIDKCHNAGGGRVVIPKGIHFSGPLRLRSNVTLYLEEGAILKASSNIDDYCPIGFKHNEWGDVKSFIYALNEENICIEGKGVIDLSGEDFMDFSKTHNDFPELALIDKDQFEETECKTKSRPNQPIFFYDCKNISIKDVKIKDSPCWTISINSSENIRVYNITIENNLRVPNSDGLHFCSCKNVIVSNSIFICGDDCIALTGITNWDRFCEDILIANCIMETRSAGVRIGHLDSKVRNVLISNLLIKNSNRGIGIFANGKNGIVKNVLINNLNISTKIFAGTWWGKGEPIVILAPCEGNLIEDVNIENVNAYSENGILIYGYDNNIRKVNFRNVNIRLRYGKNRDLFGNYLDLSPSPKIYFPDHEKKIPWIIAKNIYSLGLFGISYGYNSDFDKKDFSIDGVFENINEVYIENVRKDLS